MRLKQQGKDEMVLCNLRQVLYLFPPALESWGKTGWGLNKSIVFGVEGSTSKEFTWYRSAGQFIKDCLSFTEQDLETFVTYCLPCKRGISDP